MGQETWKGLVGKARELDSKLTALQKEMGVFKESLAAYKKEGGKEPKPKKKGFFDSLLEDDSEPEEKENEE